MKFVALLRGINVGGNNALKMSELKEVFEKAGYTHVKTYINSGNIIFESEEKESENLERKVEELISNYFFPLRVVVLSQTELQHVLSNTPSSWKKNMDLRKYIAFVKSPCTPLEVVKEINIKEGVDSIEAGPRAVYMTTKMEGITRSNLSKINTTKVYKEITIRNNTTAEKLLAIMEL
jgi:uncharacterized protein (DUF1697 family)